MADDTVLDIERGETHHNAFKSGPQDAGASPLNRFENMVVIVTGAASGMGEAPRHPGQCGLSEPHPNRHERHAERRAIGGEIKVSAIGDIATGDDGRASLRLHVVLGLSDGTTRGGHFMQGSVHPTLEIIVRESPVHLHRRKRPDLGIALIDLET
jgi:hypothetical protein